MLRSEDLSFLEQDLWPGNNFRLPVIRTATALILGFMGFVLSATLFS
jgi:hypothetical protein